MLMHSFLKNKSKYLPCLGLGGVGCVVLPLLGPHTEAGSEVTQQRLSQHHSGLQCVPVPTECHNSEPRKGPSSSLQNCIGLMETLGLGSLTCRNATMMDVC